MKCCSHIKNEICNKEADFIYGGYSLCFEHISDQIKSYSKLIEMEINKHD